MAASSFSWDLTDNSSSGDTASSGSGDALSSILQSVSQLGSSALLAFGPANSGLATNPQGQLVRYPSTVATTSEMTMTSVLLVGALVLAGFFVWKKL